MRIKLLFVIITSLLIAIPSSLNAAATSENVLFKGLVSNVLTLERMQNSPNDLFIDCPKYEVKIKLRLSKWRLFWLDKIRGWPVDYKHATKRYELALSALKKLETNEKILVTAGGSSLHKINDCEFETISLDVTKQSKGLEFVTYISY